MTRHRHKNNASGVSSENGSIRKAMSSRKPIKPQLLANRGRNNKRSVYIYGKTKQMRLRLIWFLEYCEFVEQI